MSEAFSDLAVKKKADPILGKIYFNLTAESPSASKSHLIHDGILFYRRNEEEDWVLCIPESLEFQAIDLAHSSIGHFGTNKIYKYLRLFAYFPKLEAKTRRFVSACIDCQKSKAPSKYLRSPMHPVVADKVLGLVSVDMFGPLPKARCNVTCILVILDIFSKYVKLYATRGSTGAVVTRKFVDHYVPAVGKPDAVLADRGPCFRSDIWHQRLKQLGVIPTHTSVRHPASNPVERYMKSLGNYFRIHCHQNHASWVMHLPFLENSFNNSTNASTGYSPVEIMFGKKPTNFLKEVAKFPPTTGQINQQKVWNEVSTKLREQGAKRKLRHDENENLVQFNVGDKVLLRQSNISNAAYGETKKFFHLYAGPYTVDAIQKTLTYRLINPETSEIVGVYNAALLKPFISF